MVLRMRELLSDETMQAAIMALVDSNRPTKVKDEADAIVSVRQHERAVGRDEILVDLLSLQNLIPLPVAEEETDYAKDNANPS